MAFRDLFDGDTRSKEELRQEIALRDEQIAKLGQTLSEVRASTAEEKKRAVEVALRGHNALPQTEELALRAEIRSLQVRLGKKEDTVISLRKQVQQVEQRLFERESQNTALLQQVEELQQRAGTTPQSTSNKDTGAAEDATRTYAEYKERLAKQERVVNEYAQRIAKYESEIARLKTLYAEEQSLRREKELEATNIDKSEIERLKTMYAEEHRLRLEKEFETANIRFNYERLKKAAGDYDSLKTAHERLRASSITRDEHKKICAELQRSIKGEAKKLEQAQAKLSYAEATLRTTKDEVARLRAVLISQEKKQNVTTLPVKLRSPFLHPRVLAWLLEDIDIEQMPDIPNGWLGYSGEKPWSEVLFYESLKDCGFEFWKLPDSDVKHLILGQKGWSEAQLLEQIEAIDTGQLRIYSQEMFIAKLITGRDPFDADDDELLYAFAEDHAALTYLISLAKPWPKICFGHDDDEEVEPHSPEDFQVSASPMSLMGYHVGATSPLTNSERRKVLTRIFEQMHLEFSEDSNPAYVKKWGRGASAQRLYRMAVHIKWLVETQGKDYRKTQARDEWVSDLDWLRRTYYPRVMHIFAWP